MSILLQDLRYAVRSLVRMPGFTLTVIISLALGIGANTLVYSLVDGLLLRPFPYPQADRLVAIGVRHADDRQRNFIESLSPAEYDDIRGSSGTLERFFAFDLGNRNISGGDYPERVFTGFIWGDPFATIGMRPWLGRGFTDEETTTGTGNTVAILSHRVWQSRFGSDSGVVGRAIQVNGVPRTVVGVMPPALLVMGTDLWLPMAVSPSVIPRRARQWAIVARMKDGVTLTQVQTDLATVAGAVARTWEGTNPEYAQWSLGAATWADVVSAPIRPAGLVVLGTVGFVLLLATANIASLMLARASGRQRELAVRSALGARTPRLARQLVTESLLLALAGGAAGVGIATWLMGPVSALFPARVAGLGMQPSLSTAVLAITFAVAVGVGILTSLAPIAQVARRRGSLGLAATGRWHGGSRSDRRARQVFTVAQVAIAVVLLSGATVMLRSMNRLHGVAPGVDADRVLTMRLSLPMERYEPSEVGPFFEMLADRLEAIPGVTSAAAATQFPPGNGFDATIVTEDRAESRGAARTVDVTNATEGLPETLGMRLLGGRAFAATDAAGAPRVAQLNAAAVQRFFGGANPIGRRVGLVARDDTAWHEVVGVLSDARNRGLDAPTAPEIFVPVRQQAVAWNNQLFLLVRTAGDPLALLPAVREAIRSTDPTQPVYLVRTMQAAFADAIAARRAASILLVAFAVIALVLAAVGLYGILSFLVATRTHEIGVRRALGATERSVLGLVLRETGLLMGVGTALGLAGVIALRGAIAGIAFEVAPTHPVTLAVTLLLLSATAVLAALVPGRRAVRVDPLEALRTSDGG
jgi:putative ABC transport system permease protein